MVQTPFVHVKEKTPESRYAEFPHLDKYQPQLQLDFSLENAYSFRPSDLHAIIKVEVQHERLIRGSRLMDQATDRSGSSRKIPKQHATHFYVVWHTSCLPRQ